MKCKICHTKETISKCGNKSRSLQSWTRLAERSKQKKLMYDTENTIKMEHPGMKRLRIPELLHRYQRITAPQIKIK
jgi:hypothetical protein